MAQRCPILHCCLLFLGSSWEGREGLEVNCQSKGRNAFRHQTHQTTSCFMWARMGTGQHLMPMAHGRRRPANLAFLWLFDCLSKSYPILIFWSFLIQTHISDERSIWPRLLTVAAAQDATAGSKLAFLEEGYCTWALIVPGLLPQHMWAGTAVGSLIP